MSEPYKKDPYVIREGINPNFKPPVRIPGVITPFNKKDSAPVVVLDYTPSCPTCRGAKIR
jgi:thiol-disulfide isomerase/thioredoxin